MWPHTQRFTTANIIIIIILHIVNECPKTTFPDACLQRLHSANNDALNWLEKKQQRKHSRNEIIPIMTAIIAIIIAIKN